MFDTKQYSTAGTATIFSAILEKKTTVISCITCSMYPARAVSRSGLRCSLTCLCTSCNPSSPTTLPALYITTSSLMCHTPLCTLHFVLCTCLVFSCTCNNIPAVNNKSTSPSLALPFPFNYATCGGNIYVLTTCGYYSKAT